jgi:hypothetical protein
MSRKPLLLLNRQPPPENRKREDTKEEPANVLPEQLTAFTVEHHLQAVDFRMSCNPTMITAFNPRRSNEQREHATERHQQIPTD